MSHTRLRSVIAAAHNALPYVSHTPVGMENPTSYIAKPAVVTTTLGLNADTLPSLFDKDGQLVRVPAGEIGATTVRLSTGILVASRVAAAGAHVIVKNDPTRALATGLTGTVALERNASQFRTVDAATFATVGDDDDLVVSAHPGKASDIDWDSSICKGVRIEFKRAAQSAIGVDLLTAEVMAAITLGLARAADATLLDAINATAPAAFTLAGAAAQGLKLHELGALVGTNGDGAAIAADGTLRAVGIHAELTADMVGSLVGAFDRAAIAIHEDVRLHFERRDARGDLIVTAWVNMIPLVPDAAKFWRVAAN